MKENQDPRLRKSLVGYSSKEVRRLLDEQETLIRQAQQRADTAQHAYAQIHERLAELEREGADRDRRSAALQAKLDELTGELQHAKEISDAYRQHADRYRQQAERLTAELEQVRADLQEARDEAERARIEHDASRATEGVAELVNGEVSRIITAAQESAARIVETARETGKRKSEDAERMWSEVQVEIARFVSWWEQIHPLLQSLHSQMGDARGRLGELGDRVRDALSPILQAMIEVDGNIARVTQHAPPPELKTPSGLDAEDRAEAETGPEDAPADAEAEEGSSDPSSPVSPGVVRLS